MKKIIAICIALGLPLLVSCTNQSENDTEIEEQTEVTHKEEKDENKVDDSTAKDEQAEHEEEVDRTETDESDTETAESEEQEEKEVVLENEVFKIFEPAPGSEVTGDFVVSGSASVHEGTVIYEFEDGHFILDEGVVTASETAPDWGLFEITINLDEVDGYAGRVILFAENPEDGTRIHELQIPIQVIGD